MKDEASQDLVQGSTFCSVLFDEVVLMPESFYNQATGRCSVEDSKIFINCNPGSPYHWVYTELIQKLSEKNGVYLHFDMDDNPSLSEKIKDRYKRNYSGVFYKRFILGKWCLADGLIYDMFVSERHVIKLKDVPFRKIRKWWISCDYGTGNATVFLLQCKTYDGKFYTVKEYYYDGHTEESQKTDLEYADDMKEFISLNSDLTGLNYKQIEILIDPAAASFRLQLRRFRMRVKNAKNSVLDGIRTVATMIGSERFYVVDECKNTIKELSTYSWDEKAQLKGIDAPKEINDHTCDAFRYGVFTNRDKESVRNAAMRVGI